MGQDAESSVRRIGAVSGIIGAFALVAYFIAPALVGWPYGGAPAAELADFAMTHATLFYAGAWLQVTGTLLSVVLFLAIIRLARASDNLAGLVTIVGSAVLLATVVVEAAFLVAVPVAASAGDLGTVSSMFALSNGGFVRVFPLAPASATLIGLGIVIRASRVLAYPLGTIALGLGVAFEFAGILAIASPVGVVLAALLAVFQGAWVIAAAVSIRPRAVAS